jgi:hypothetical protein
VTHSRPIDSLNLSSAPPRHPTCSHTMPNLIVFCYGPQTMVLVLWEKVTEAVLRKHTDEAARRQNVAGMGANPAPATTLKITPITGNNISESRARSLVPTVTPLIFDNDSSHSDHFAASPPPAASLPHFLSPHSINEDDFPPDPIQYVHDPARFGTPPQSLPINGGI